MNLSRWTIASIICAALTVVSLYGCYSFIRMPLTRYSNNVDLRYTQSADYNYTAYVKPSLLYDNRTEIGEGEPLYTELVERLDITLNYNLEQTPSPVEMTDVKVVLETSGKLSGGDWSKTYNLVSANDTFISPSTFSETYTLEMKDIQEIVETIDEETDTRVYAYTYEIKPKISLEASAGNKTIEQEFVPVLTIKFEGGKIEFEGLKDSETGSVTHREAEVATYRIFGWSMEVDDMRGLSIIAASLLSMLIFYSGRNTLRERASRTPVERLSEEVREKIVEVREPPERIEKSTIRVNSLEDLARVAEEAFKTIIHHGDIYHVLDGDVRYEYKMEAESDLEDEEIDCAR